MTLLSSYSRRSLIIAFDIKKQCCNNRRQRLLLLNHYYYYHPSIATTSTISSSVSSSSASTTINGLTTKRQHYYLQPQKQLLSPIKRRFSSFVSSSLLLSSSSSFHNISGNTTTTTDDINTIILRQQQRRRKFSSSSSSSSTDTDDDIQSSSSSSKKILKVAIVGSGPSGCYTAKYLQSGFANLNNKKQQQQEEDSSSSSPTTANITKLHIDILDRLPTPYGLVRNGVAPDHPEVKNVQNDFDILFSSSSSSKNSGSGSSNSNSNIQFYGNVNVGGNDLSGISLEELRQLYDIVVLAYGCESDRNLPIMDNNTAKTNTNVLSARQFVNWYNGHIDYNYIGNIVEKCLSKSKKNQNNIVVIGHGNVALDCARILAKSYDELNPTDITTQSLNIIQQQPKQKLPQQPNRKKRIINILGRRGHIQAAFTIKEIRELTKLPNAKFVVLKDELDAGKSTQSSQQELKDSRPRTRIDKLLTEHCNNNHEKEETTTTHDNNEDNEDDSNNNTVVNLRFLMNPIRLESDHDDDNSNNTTVTRVVCERTELVGDVGKQRAQGTGIEEIFDADLVLVSIGYKGLAIPGTEQWYDESKGIIQNTNGFVDDGGRGRGSNDNNNNFLAPLYVSGWLKRGPSGIIGTNIADAKDTVSSILKDYLASIDSDIKEDEKKDSSSSLLSLKELLQERNVQIVDWKGYQRIDDVERNDMKRKRHPDQPREKIITKSELLEVASRKNE